MGTLRPHMQVLHSAHAAQDNTGQANPITTTTTTTQPPRPQPQPDDDERLI
ncbi:hypothetical protein SCLCIDRAFT_33621 [Scleroderma citrinum Foug A]|uniref:Uncharacterized protein n=1 Tax=Scleroderma citrinum Foug A TaxID=1036808 RepID=A0A0C3CRJ1_9AGAM|nr:hypothetical protein SCLCIDRAFT_33621 [Scleroderma citrinum Foug A]